jgi:hypothetical protein
VAVNIGATPRSPAAQAFAEGDARGQRQPGRQDDDAEPGRALSDGSTAPTTYAMHERDCLMNMKMKLIAGFIAVAVLAAGAAGGAMWYMAKPVAGHADAAEAKAPPPPATGKKARKFLTLDKVVVMLRRGPGDTDTHYLSADLVVATTEEKKS